MCTEPGREAPEESLAVPSRHPEVPGAPPWVSCSCWEDAGRVAAAHARAGRCATSPSIPGSALVRQWLQDSDSFVRARGCGI